MLIAEGAEFGYEDPLLLKFPLYYRLDVIVTLDQHPSDIRWEILSSAQNFSTIVAISPPYDASMELKADRQSFCLADGMYQFNIYDDNADGG